MKPYRKSKLTASYIQNYKKQYNLFGGHQRSGSYVSGFDANDPNVLSGDEGGSSSYETLKKPQKAKKYRKTQQQQTPSRLVEDEPTKQFREAYEQQTPFYGRPVISEGSDSETKTTPLKRKRDRPTLGQTVGRSIQRLKKSVESDIAEIPGGHTLVDLAEEAKKVLFPSETHDIDPHTISNVSLRQQQHSLMERHSLRIFDKITAGSLLQDTIYLVHLQADFWNIAQGTQEADRVGNIVHIHSTEIHLLLTAITLEAPSVLIHVIVGIDKQANTATSITEVMKTGFTRNLYNSDNFQRFHILYDKKHKSTRYPYNTVGIGAQTRYSGPPFELDLAFELQGLTVNFDNNLPESQTGNDMFMIILMKGDTPDISSTNWNYAIDARTVFNC